jgi:hypothetical protein
MWQNRFCCYVAVRPPLRVNTLFHCHILNTYAAQRQLTLKYVFFIYLKKITQSSVCADLRKSIEVFVSYFPYDISTSYDRESLTARPN